MIESVEAAIRRLVEERGGWDLWAKASCKSCNGRGTRIMQAARGAPQSAVQCSCTFRNLRRFVAEYDRLNQNLTGAAHVQSVPPSSADGARAPSPNQDAGAAAGDQPPQ